MHVCQCRTFLTLPALLVLDDRRRGVRVSAPRQLDEGEHGTYLRSLYRYPWLTLAVSAGFTGGRYG